MPVNLTPAHLRCSLGGCPSVHEMEDGDLTPENMRCPWGDCSSVTSYKGDLVIVGKIAAGLATQIIREDGRPLSETIGADETAIVISPDLLANLPEILHLRSQVAKLKQALEPFAREADRILADGTFDDPELYDADEDFPMGSQEMMECEACHDIRLSDLRRARAALTEEDKENG